MNIDEIINEEPSLGVIIADSKQYMKSKHLDYERENYWYRIVKPKIKNLVGWMAKNSKLANSRDYDVVYRHFINILKF